ncbi:MAG TPA: ROK family protein [Ferruginibacter sp.]|nr:ROK family protein [Ferruginibacter sp.]HMP20008.1 ROK family protein [Ferruginibacter sp.]
MNNKTYIGIDLGGTRIKGIAIGADGNILHQTYTPTNDGNGEVWKTAIKKTVSDLKEITHSANAIVGISAPGLPDNTNTCIAFMPGRLEGLENFIWSDFLQTPSYVLNDGVAAMVAEAKTGAAQNSTNAVLLTLGTGVGGAILINGKPYQGSFNKAGHFGHSVVDCNGDGDVTNMPGSLEECIGNCTIEKRSSGKFSSTHELLVAYRKGDIFAKEVWLKSVKHLAISLASICNILSPDTVVIGGGIAEANDDLFVPLNTMIDEYEWQPGGIKATIVKAQHADLAGAIGAAFFAKEKFNEANK